MIDFIAEDKSMANVHDMIELASKTSNNVIIYGETGTGKEIVAKNIHLNSCPDKPIITINSVHYPRT